MFAATVKGPQFITVLSHSIKFYPILFGSSTSTALDFHQNMANLCKARLCSPAARTQITKSTKMIQDESSLKTNLLPQSNKSGNDRPRSSGICSDSQCCSKKEFRSKCREASSLDNVHRDSAKTWPSCPSWLTLAREWCPECHRLKSGWATSKMAHNTRAKWTMPT
jgi:hypothetical protein